MGNSVFGSFSTQERAQGRLSCYADDEFLMISFMSMSGSNWSMKVYSTDHLKTIIEQASMVVERQEELSNTPYAWEII
ncbi:hypothetical protein OAD85_08310 [Actinomycetota bacterium]|nr:hypothetical protein [Actinomycetota bacterium]